MKKHTTRIVALGYMVVSISICGFGGEKNGKEELAHLDDCFDSDFRWHAFSHYDRKLTYPYNASTRHKIDVDGQLKATLKISFIAQQLLAEQGAHVEAVRYPEGSSQSALYNAIKMNHTDYVNLLLKHGARSIEVFEGLSLNSIFAARNQEIFELLIWYGVVKEKDIKSLENEEDCKFALAALNSVKAKYAHTQEEWQKQHVLIRLLGRETFKRTHFYQKLDSKAQTDLKDVVKYVLAPFVQSEKPGTFKQYVDIIGSYAVVQQLIKRMHILGIQIIERPNSNPSEYVVIDPNLDTTTSNAEIRKHREETSEESDQDDFGAEGDCEDDEVESGNEEGELHAGDAEERRLIR